MKNQTPIERASDEFLKPKPLKAAACLRTPGGKTRAARFGLALILILGVAGMSWAQMMGGGGGMMGGGGGMGASNPATGVAVSPSSVALDSGPGTGMEVQGRIYPAGAAVPAGAPLVITVKLGDREHRLTLATRPMTNRSGNGSDRDEDQRLGGNEREFYRVMAKKTVRVATDPLVRRQLARLDEQESPLEIRGWVTGSASPILTLEYVGALANDSTDGVSTPRALTATGNQ